MKLIRLKAFRLAALLALALALTAQAAVAAETPKLLFELPGSAQLGQVLNLKAQLVDATGKPIADATLYFTVPSTFFLGTTSDVVIARVNTDKDGWAQSDYRVRTSGRINIRAEFRGNERFTSVKTDAPLAVDGSHGQLYVQEAGVRVPGLTAAPFAAESPHEAPTGLGRLWPTLSFWPLGLALLVVWSCYAFVVLQVFRLVSNSRQTARGLLDGVGERNRRPLEWKG